jgi:hypothetical protein
MPATTSNACAPPGTPDAEPCRIDQTTRHIPPPYVDLADVERYPEFVPLCRAMRVMRRTRTDDREVIVAR